MPRFDFECQNCGKVFERELSFGSRRFPRCAECGGKTEKLILPPVIHFKGSGFYATDAKKGHEIKPTSPKEEKKAETTTSEPKAEKNSKKSEK
ncbi:MAG: FmdB family zinc ribbon protein [Candidatus Peregrinibacteria bacterium]